MTRVRNILCLKYSVVLMALVCFGCGSSGDDTGSVAEGKPSDSVADSVAVELLGADSVSVLDLLLAEHEVDYITSSMGAFVKGIGSIENGGGYVWTYTVNDSAAQVAADRYLTVAGDRVVWHFRRAGQ